MQTTAKKLCKIVLLMVAGLGLGVNAGETSSESYSAQDEFEAALAKTITSPTQAERLAASAEHALAVLKDNTTVSLWSLEYALERSESNPGPSYEAVAVAYVVLSDIADEVHYHRDTRIRLAGVLESVARVSRQ